MARFKSKIGTKLEPLELKTPPGTASYTMHVDEKDGTEILVCTVGTTVLHYDMRSIDDLAAMLKKHGDWMLLGSKDEKQDTKEGTDIEATHCLRELSGLSKTFRWGGKQVRLIEV